MLKNFLYVVALIRTYAPIYAKPTHSQRVAHADLPTSYTVTTAQTHATADNPFSVYLPADAVNGFSVTYALDAQGRFNGFNAMATAEVYQNGAVTTSQVTENITLSQIRAAVSAHPELYPSIPLTSSTIAPTSIGSVISATTADSPTKLKITGAPTLVTLDGAAAGIGSYNFNPWSPDFQLVQIDYSGNGGYNYDTWEPQGTWTLVRPSGAPGVVEAYAYTESSAPLSPLSSGPVSDFTLFGELFTTSPYDAFANLFSSIPSPTLYNVQYPDPNVSLIPRYTAPGFTPPSTGGTLDSVLSVADSATTATAANIITLALAGIAIAIPLAGWGFVRRACNKL